jgi:hypothetical protein
LVEGLRRTWLWSESLVPASASRRSSLARAAVQAR